MDILTLGIRCDTAIENENLEELHSLVSQIGEMKLDGLNFGDICHLEYMVGNLYASISSISKENFSDWRKQVFPKYRVESINSYRRALTMAEICDSPLALQIITNLANEISYQGRTTEAISNWVIDFNEEDDSPVVAAFAKARSLIWLTQYVNDSGHASCYFIEAYKLLKILDEMITEDSHPTIYREVKNNKQVRNILDDGDENFQDLLEWQRSEPDPLYSYEEKQYRWWCLEMGLFANHLNDLTSEWIADRDILQFPSYMTKTGHAPYLSSAFSAIKREYCFARFLAFEGVNGMHPVYENNQLFLADTYDGVRFEGDIEKVKTAFRISFSTLDSIATLLDQYFDCNSKQPTFSSRWISTNLSDHQNPFVDALYWLACDLTDTSSISSGKWKAPNPEAGEIRRVRNAIEHGWIRVVELKTDKSEDSGDYAHIVSSEELNILTIDVLRIVRAAMQYLCFAVKFEAGKRKDNHKDMTTVNKQVPLWDKNCV